MTTVEQKKNLKDFVERWRGRGYEKGDTHQFWLQLLGAVGYEQKDSVLFEQRVGNGGFIDVWVRDANVMIEQKSIEVDLDKPEPRQGEMKTPFKQVLDYAEAVPLSEQPSFLVTCNFATFRVYDRNKWDKSALESNAFTFTLEELADHPDYLNFILDPKNSRLEKEKTVSIQAGERIGQLYDLLRQGYIDPDSEESMHALNVLCVRLVFCLYCEDADLFEKDSFLQYLKGTAPGDVRLKLKTLFQALDTERPDRDPYDTNINIFPYVNGGLFKEDVEIPNFTQEALDFLLDEVSAPIDWSQISPTIFGGIFESTLNPETRRSGGMHYTSPENIHKVIDPLFLDDLWEEFNAIRDAEDLTPRQKDNRYKKFHQKICGLTFFDPACGSGNFLTETYLCLRKLEDTVLGELRKGGIAGQMEFTSSAEEESGDRISLTQFHGIEINDFAVSVAETALYISRLKANADTMMLLDVDSGDLPLKESACIVLGNALRMDWNSVVPADECDYIMGNPPFIGARQQSKNQKKDLVEAFNGMKGVGNLDYVSGWYAKATEYISKRPTRVAYVSTNSICQGEQVPLLWKSIFEKGFSIDFAHDTFRWTNKSMDQAHVYVIVVGFSKQNINKLYYHYPSPDSIPIKQSVNNINGYLKDAPTVFVEPQSAPLSQDAKPINYGSFALDDGNYTISAREHDALIEKNPKIEQFLRPFLGANEIIKGISRWCLWLQDYSEEELQQYEEIVERINNVRSWRALSSRKTTAELAKTPLKFAEVRQPNSSYLAIPTVSGEKRQYIPMKFLSADVIASNQIYVLPNATFYDFGILHSQFHNAWMRTVAGRLENRYRYAAAVVYNTFPWPTPTKEQKAVIEECGRTIMGVRSNHSGKNLAQMYDGISPLPIDSKSADKKKYHLNEYDDLLAAHKALDKAVEEAYGVDFDGDEEKIVAHLFKLYQEKVEELENPTPKKKAPEKPEPKKAAVKVKVKKKQ